MTTVSLGELYASSLAVEREGERIGEQCLQPCGMTTVSLGEPYASSLAVEREGRGLASSISSRAGCISRHV